MEDILRDLCKRHDLTAVAVSCGPYSNRWKIAAYLHCEIASDEVCTHGFGDTFKDAFDEALHKLTAKRDNAAEAAWQAQQDALAESGGPDDSAYRRNMIEAGRGHLLR